MAVGILQNNASKLLLAIMESRHDSENAEKILYKMRPMELVRRCASPRMKDLSHTKPYMSRVCASGGSDEGSLRSGFGERRG